jgi:hypothetical protein
MGVSKVTGVADSAASFCELLSFVLTGVAFELRRKHFSMRQGDGQFGSSTCRPIAARGAKLDTKGGEPGSFALIEGHQISSCVVR